VPTCLHARTHPEDFRITGLINGFSIHPTVKDAITPAE